MSAGVHGGTARDRILANVAIEPGGCWTWQRHVQRNGYGTAWFNGRTRLAHRVAYEVLVGPIPDGLTIDHLCRVKSCVNPAHLEPVTNRENNLRRPGSRVATHCARGHEFGSENTRWEKGHYGFPTRRCIQCHRDREKVRPRRDRRKGAPIAARGGQAGNPDVPARRGPSPDRHGSA